MRLTRFIVILAMSFMFAQWAVAGFPPVRIGGILQSLVTKFTLLFPAKSVVNRGGVTAYIDTDVSNLLHDGSFEGIALSSDWSLSGGTATFETADKVDGNQALRITASASTPILRQTVSTKSGLPLVVGCMVKTDQNFVEICAKDNTTDVLCTNVPSDNTWRFLKFPIVAGNDGGIEVRSSQNITGNIDVDKCRVEYSDTTQDIAQSELAFDVNIGTVGTAIVGNATSTYTAISNSSADMVVNKGSNLEIPCSSTNPSTGLTCSVGSENFGVVFDAQVGTYEICAEFSTFVAPSTFDAFATFQLVETPNNAQTILQEGKSRQSSGGNTADANKTKYQSMNVCGTFDFTTAGRKTIRLMYERTYSTNFYLLTDRNPSAGQRDMHITGKYYPPKTKIVTELQEETVETANEFSAKVSNTDIVSDENFDWINGDCTNATTGQATCNFNSGIFSVAPNCVCTNGALGVSGTENDCFINSLSNTSITVTTTNNIIPNNSSFNLFCQKQGADYNKSRMVYGQFEQIKSGDTPIVRAQGNAGQSITGTTDIPFIEIKDNFNAWDGDSFTVPTGQGGQYLVAGSNFVSASVVAGVYIAVNGVREQIFGFHSSSSQIHPFSGVVELSEGDVLSIRLSGGTGLSNNTDFHHLHIQKIPDIESLVKNLNPSNVKCQTKVLSGNVYGVDGVLTDLTFNNLVIGKKYKSILWGRFQFVAVDNSMGLYVLNNSKYVNFIEGSSAAGTYYKGYGNTSIFTAEATTATTTLSSTGGPANGVTYQFGTDFRATGHTLCELPDNWINTTEF